MKKFLLVLTTMLFAIVALAGCGANNKQSSNEKVIKVGATTVPHAEILEQVKEDLAKDGIKLEIVEYSDYVQPNLNLNDKELDANYFQHVPYLDDFNAQNGTHIVSVAGIHVEPLGIYAGKLSSLSEIK